MLRPIPSRAVSRLRPLTGTCISAILASASGPGPSLAQVCRFKTSTSVKHIPVGTTVGYSKLTSQDLDEGFRREVEKSRAREPFDVEYLRETLARRPHRASYDYLTPGHSHLLNIALWDALPPEAGAGKNLKQPQEEASFSRFLMPSTSAPAGDSGNELPSGHHLVYFPLQRPISLLEPDGTDPAQSPGVPFVRRMWAGGALDFRKPQNLQLDGRRAVCVERLDAPNMVLRGSWGQEKIFVDVVRRYGAAVPNIDPSLCMTKPEQLLALENKGWEDADLEERRTLVFMRTKAAVPERKAMATAKTPGNGERIIKYYSFSFTPSSTLLFQFSALTYNAHAIHLDVNYCRNIEGHRDLLVHGPLTLVLMLSAIRSRNASTEIPPSRFIRKFEYRNIAPLYAGEELRVCVRYNGQQSAGDECIAKDISGRWDAWVENSRGSICARGTAVTHA
ncbi:hypothetical protein SEPCBS57363_005122 [Sporothrix epigloea]|uniref:Uncharacterized protein n=1 Tax=Sporothrix epigloea TaxID=1892477 RepID=A0ABP0DVT5_9PEZI